MRAHFAGAECAIEPDGKRARMPHTDPEGFDRLAAQSATRSVGDRAGNHDRHPTALIFKYFFNGENSCFRIEGVEYRFDQKDVRAAVEQAADLFGIGVFDLVETDGPEARVVDIGREAEGFVERADGAGHETRLVGRFIAGRGRFLVVGVRCAAGDLRGPEIDLVGQVARVVIGL